MFVKKGVSDFEAHGRASLIAAEELSQSQDALERVLDKLSSDPENEELALEREKLELEVADKTHALQVASGADVPDLSLDVEKSALKAAKSQLAHIEEKLKDAPNDPHLVRQRDELEEAIRAKDQAMQAAATAEHQAEEAKSEVDSLTSRLRELQDAADKDPQSKAIQEEKNEIQSKLDAKTAARDAMTPKKECYRVCVNPNTHSQTAGRRLLAGVAAKDVNNCIRLCVKVMHHLANRMAQ